MRGVGSGLKNMAMCITNLDLRGVVGNAVLSMFVVTIRERFPLKKYGSVQNKPRSERSSGERCTVHVCTCSYNQ